MIIDPVAHVVYLMNSPDRVPHKTITGDETPVPAKVESKPVIAPAEFRRRCRAPDDHDRKTRHANYNREGDLVFAGTTGVRAVAVE